MRAPGEYKQRPEEGVPKPKSQRKVAGCTRAWVIRYAAIRARLHTPSALQSRAEPSRARQSSAHLVCVYPCLRWTGHWTRWGADNKTKERVCSAAQRADHNTAQERAGPFMLESLLSELLRAQQKDTHSVCLPVPLSPCAPVCLSAHRGVCCE